MKAILLAVVLTLSSVYPASAQRLDWKPIAAVTFGQSFDAISTVRFLSNGSGCTEANRFLGAQPATWTLVGQKAAVILGSALVVKVSGRSTSKPIRIIGQSFAYVLGATGTHSGLRNARLCGL